MPPLLRRCLDDVDPTAGFPLHPFGGVGCVALHPQRALHAGLRTLHRNFGEVGKDHDLLVGPLGAATNLESGCRELVVEVGQFDEQIGAFQGHSRLADEVVDQPPPHLPVGDENDLAAGAEAERLIGGGSEKRPRFVVGGELPKYDRAAANGAAVPHLGTAERVGLPGEVDGHPHPTGAGSLEAIAADAQANARGEGCAGIGVEVENLQPHATLVVEHADVAGGEFPGERRAMDRRRATVFIPIERPRAKRHRPEGRARTPRRGALEEGEMEGILVGPPPFLPFEKRDLGVDPPTLGKQASGEEDE